MSFLDKIFGDPNKKALSKLEPIVDEINSLESTVEKLSDDELKAKTKELRHEIRNGKPAEEVLPESFAIVREASKRVLKMRHFDVQLMGGITLFQGDIAEMKTGEGKTLVATLPAYLCALEGKKTYIVTVNDYLAKFQSEWMGKLYKFLGLTVGITMHGQTPEEKKKNYECDIVYGTNNEFGFDFLRDNMVQDINKKTQKSLDFAIVDEVDSILIDEARTPLIISAPAEESTNKYYEFFRIINNLEENKDYNVDEKLKSASLTDTGITKLEQILGISNIYQQRGIETIHHIEQALKAKSLFKRDRDYVVKDNDVVIVDDFTGRLMPGRRFSDGLHQALEAKEGLQVKRESLTLATITFQNYFRQYSKLSGMTGTAMTSKEEFQNVYNLDVIAIPTNKPCIRKDRNDVIYSTELAKFKAVARDVKEKHDKGQPVLIGTVSIEKNERLSEVLNRAGITHTVLNAKNHEKEAAIISNAGKLGAVTCATNMAGRGVDIILGGSESNKQEAATVKDLGGLHVIGTERHEARRIDNQLRGRSGRQGDPGSTRFYTSMEDDLLRLFGSDRMKTMVTTLRLPEDQPIEHKIITRSLESAQKKVEMNNYEIRKHVLEYDNVMNKHREVIYRQRDAILKSWDYISKKNDPDFKDDLKEPNVTSLKDRVLNFIKQEVEQVVSRHTSNEDTEEWNLEEIAETTNTIYQFNDNLHSKLTDILAHSEKDKKGAPAKTQLIKYIYKNLKSAYEQKEKQVGEVLTREIEKTFLLRTYDRLWIDHLDIMAKLREGIGLRGYGQRDPLVEYKKESFSLFQELLGNIQNNIVYNIFKISIVKKEQSPMESQNMSLSGSKEESTPKTIDNKNKTVGRNDPCTCGSGKKYKKCCGKEK